MRNPSPEVIEKWVSCGLGCDFSDFVVPTTDTVPWGEPGQIVILQMDVNPNGDGIDTQRTVRQGVWDRDRHALAIPMPTKRDPNRTGACGLYGLVRLYLQEGWQEHQNGFVVHGRSLLEDEGKLVILMNAIVENEINRLLTSYSNLLDKIPKPPGYGSSPCF